MAALNFPDSPTLNQSFVSPSGKQWIWNGTRWQAAQETVLTTAVEYVKNLISGTGISLADAGGTASTPTVSVDVSTIATKSYVNSIAAGINWHEAVRLCTAAQLPDSPAYNNGDSGVGATLTATSNARLMVDGANASNGDRILVKNQTAAAQNGIYIVTDQGSVSSVWVLTRDSDFDGSPANEITPGEAVFVTAGSVNIRQGYVVTTYGTGTDDAHIVGTDDISFTQFTGIQAFTAGDGLTSSGNSLNVATANATRIVVNADNIDLAEVGQTNTTAANTTSFVSAVSIDSYGRVTGQANATVDLSSTILKATINAKGDLIVGSASATPSLLPSSEDGYFLRTDAAQSTGLVWAQAAINDLSDVNTSGITTGHYLKYDGANWVPNTISLGGDTTGSYVASLVAGTGISLENNTGENATPTISIGQDVATTASPVFAGLTLTGNLNVSGTTTVVNSTIITVDDPVMTLGGDTAPETDDDKDRGIEFRWHNGTAAKIGFFGYDDSSGRFTFIPDATNTSEVFSGDLGAIDVSDVYINGTASTGTGAVVRANAAVLTGNVKLPSTTELLEDYLSLTANTTLSLASHRFKVIEVNSASAVVVTVPTAATEDFPVGTVLTFVRVGAGEVTINNAAGVTLDTPVGKRLRAQWSTATLRKRGSDTWLLSGDIKV